MPLPQQGLPSTVMTMGGGYPTSLKSSLDALTTLLSWEQKSFDVPETDVIDKFKHASHAGHRIADVDRIAFQMGAIGREVRLFLPWNAPARAADEDGRHEGGSMFFLCREAYHRERRFINLTYHRGDCPGGRQAEAIVLYCSSPGQRFQRLSCQPVARRCWSYSPESGNTQSERKRYFSRR